MITFFVFLISSLLVAGITKSAMADDYTNSLDSENMLIVLSAPSVNEPYYTEVFEQIIAFDIAYAKAVMGHDNVIVLADKDTLPYLQEKLPSDILLEAEVADIWIRDFSTVVPSQMVQFRYQPSYLPKLDSSYIQNSFNHFTTTFELDIAQSDLILDGGNVVDNNFDKIIVTDRISEDNPDYSRKEIIDELKAILNVQYVAIIPQEEGEPMGHADGIAMFVSNDTVMINTFGEPFRTQVLEGLRQGFPGIIIVEIEAEYSLEVWKDFVSACGINLNSTVTNNYIYMPTFGNQNDSQSQKAMQLHTNKEIITIDARDVCFMGGSVRCLSWQVSGENAEKLILAARE